MKNRSAFLFQVKRYAARFRLPFFLNGLLILTFAVFPGLTPLSVTKNSLRTASSQPLTASLAATPAPITREAILTNAMTWVDWHLPYPDQNNKDYKPDPRDNGYRQDCSGFVSMAWGLSNAGGGLNTVSLESVSTPIQKDDLLPGDIVNNPSPLNLELGHTVMFLRWDNSAHTRYDGLEESLADGETGHQIAGAHLSHNIPYPYWGVNQAQNDYVPMRRNNIKETTLLMFEVALSGIANSSGNNNQPNRPQQSMEVQVLNGNDILIQTSQVVATYHPGMAGYYDMQPSGSMPGKDQGSFVGFLDLGVNWTPSFYIFNVRLPYTLGRHVSGFYPIVYPTALALPLTPLISGDSNYDNKKDILDYNMLIDCYSDLLPAKNCNPAKKVATDLNEDGQVNQLDYNIWLSTTTLHCAWCYQ